MEEEVISLEQIEQITKEVLEKFLIPDYEKSGRNYSGQTLNSFNVRAERDRGVFTGDETVKWLIQGRVGNKDQSPEAVRNWVKWYAPNVIEPWANAKGVTINPYIISYKIAREGYKGNDEFLRILGTQEVKDYVTQRITEMIGSNIHTFFKSSLTKLRNA